MTLAFHRCDHCKFSNNANCNVNIVKMQHDEDETEELPNEEYAVVYFI